MGAGFRAHRRLRAPIASSETLECARGNRLFHGIVGSQQHLARETMAAPSSPAPCPRVKFAC